MTTPRLLMSTAAISLALACPSSQAIAPAIVFIAKQMLSDMVTSSAKSMLLDSLSGMGCKGQALANAISTAGNATSVRGLLGGAGGVPTMPGMGMGAGMAAMPPEMAAKMQSMVPPGMVLPDMSTMMAQLQGAGLGAPLSRLETMATIDEMSELGMLNKAMNTELKECLVLLPAAAPAMGMAMGMMKPVLPKIREAREQMRALSPAEQDELVNNLAQEFDKVPAQDRKAMLGELGNGMFPPRVVEALNKRYSGK